ncbi:MAG: tryptophan-rich sensory protein, partial [Candidatus Micrarchaeota archaeon]|nr:tryptophan-rich sensory protein [Candidatus Micrarchaeota archaeon]
MAKKTKRTKNASTQKQNWLVLAGFILLSLLAGAIGSLFTFEAIPTWYATLNKPSFAPPNWLFGPVWTTLYILMGVSAYLICQKGAKNEKVKFALSIFCIQLALNALWSILFFGLRSPLYGLVGIVFLWLSIAA